VPAASASPTNEGDAVRLRGRVRFDDTLAPR
jgi:hypothetical protein